MGAVDCARQTARFMADITFYYSANVTLQPHYSLVVVGAVIGIGPYRMGAAVAAFTSNFAMPLAEAKECVRIFRKAFI